jgi:hypothetical protein
MMSSQYLFMSILSVENMSTSGNLRSSADKEIRNIPLFRVYRDWTINREHLEPESEIGNLEICRAFFFP